MPYQSYFPASYPQMYPQIQPQIQIPQAQIQPQPQAQVQTPQMSNTRIGLIPTPSEQYARDFPVALNDSVTFIDEKLPYIYSKTMGSSQLEQPRFEKYKLVKVEDEQPSIPIQAEQHEVQEEFVTKSEFDKIQSEIKNLKATIKNLTKTQTKGVKYESADE